MHHRYYMVSSAVPSLHGIVAGRAGLTLFSMGPHTCSPFPRPGVVPGASAMHLPTDYERRLVAGARLLSSAEQRLGPVFGWRKGYVSDRPSPHGPGDGRTRERASVATGVAARAVSCDMLTVGLRSLVSSHRCRSPVAARSPPNRSIAHRYDPSARPGGTSTGIGAS